MNLALVEPTALRIKLHVPCRQIGKSNSHRSADAHGGSLEIYALVDARDYDYLVQWSWKWVRGANGCYFAVRYSKNRPIYMHREVLALRQKRSFRQVEHINGNTLDNRYSNLEISIKDSPKACRSKEETPYYSLTEKQKEIAQLALLGNDKKEIAAQLFLSVKTVNSHLTQIYQFLQVDNSIQMLAVLKQAPDLLTAPRKRPAVNKEIDALKKQRLRVAQEIADTRKIVLQLLAQLDETLKEIQP